VFERFSDDARRVVVVAQEEARQLGHGHIGTEHLLLGLLGVERSEAARVLGGAGVTVDAARQKVIDAVGRGGGADASLPFTARAKRALERAHRFSLQRRARHIETEHVLQGVLDVEGTAGQVLRGLGVDVSRLLVAEAAPAPAPEEEPTAIVLEPEDVYPYEPPHCPGCGVPLDGNLTQRVVEGDGGSFLVVHCSACGHTLGASPA
jgi:ATP-dependent Clp protease ATP-binding subunit ClpA